MRSRKSRLFVRGFVAARSQVVAGGRITIHPRVIARLNSRKKSHMILHSTNFLSRKLCETLASRQITVSETPGVDQQKAIHQARSSLYVPQNIFGEVDRIRRRRDSGQRTRRYNQLR